MHNNDFLQLKYYGMGDDDFIVNYYSSPSGTLHSSPDPYRLVSQELRLLRYITHKKHRKSCHFIKNSKSTMYHILPLNTQF